MDKLDIRERLQALTLQLKPTEEDLQDTLRKQYDNLCKVKGRMTIDDWLAHWIALEARLKMTGVSNLPPDEAIKAFVISELFSHGLCQQPSCLCGERCLVERSIREVWWTKQCERFDYGFDVG
jgi:hypothetical protein